MNGSTPRSRSALVLASSSRYRRALLERFGVPFAVDAPDIDETPRPGESARRLVQRLAVAKARAVAPRWPGALIIGSDQAATFDGRILGKPGTAERAVAQLLACSGRQVEFLTGVAVLRAPDGDAAVGLDITTARFRCFDAASAQRYVERDRPLDCAGAIRFEGYGPLLLRGVDTVDPSAAIGLPLIQLGALLRAAGLDPLG